MATKARSTRSNTRVLTDEVGKAVYYCVKGQDQNGFVKKYINDDIGVGVFAVKGFKKGDFLLQYPGELIFGDEGETRSVIYTEEKLDNFLYYFQYKELDMCIDATISTLLGKYVNDAVNPNCIMKRINVHNSPSLCLFALQDLVEGTELRYKYSGTSYWWRKNPSCKKPFMLKDVIKNTHYEVTKQNVLWPAYTNVTGNHFNGGNNSNDPTQLDQVEVIKQILEDIILQIIKDEDQLCDNTMLRVIEQEDLENYVKKDAVVQSDDIDFHIDACGAVSGIINTALDLGVVTEMTATVCTICGKFVDKVRHCMSKHCADYLKTVCSVCFEDHVCRKILDTEGDVSLVKVDNACQVKTGNMHDIPVEDICAEVQKLKEKLMGIFSGRVPCRRHDRFKRGGIEKATLNMEQGFGLFTDDQENAIGMALVKMFCSDKTVYFDYVMKVLYPETKAMVYSTLVGVSLEEADSLIVHGRPNDKIEASDGENSVYNDFESNVPSKDIRSTDIVSLNLNDDVPKKPLRRVNECKRKCPVKSCVVEVYDLPRHMRQVHDWSKEKSKCVNLLSSNRKKYAWKGSPPKRSIKRTSEKGDSSRKYRDYHKKCRCPILNCFAVVKRIDQHLKSVHKIDPQSEIYGEYLRDATVWKDINKIDEWKKNRKYERREAIRENCAKTAISPDFRESVEERNITYVAESKKDNETFVLRESDCEKDTPEIVVPNIDIFSKCQNFLVSVDGGRLESSTAASTVNNIKNILKALASDDLSDLVSRIKIRDAFLGKYCEDQMYAPLTIKKYLNSLMHFYDFLINEEVLLKNFTTDDILRMKILASKWSKSYNSAVKEHETCRCEEEIEVLLIPEQVEMYESSEDAQNAIKLFWEYASEYPCLTQSDYCIMREYLLVQINLQNSHRSGVCSNITIAEFNSAHLENDLIRIKVKKHKTARTYGPAKLYLKQNVYQYFKIFITNVRSQIIGSSPYVFVSFFGTQLESGQISRQINATWQRAGVYGDSQPSRNLSCTIFRKSASTAVLEHNPECAKDVADLLLHSEKTQKKYYDVRRRELSTARGATLVGNLLRYRTINPSSPQKEEISRQQCVSTQSPRRSWTPDEINEVKRLFADSIREKMITMEMVKSMECDFVLLKDIPLKKICDKVRSLYRLEEVGDNHKPECLASDTLKEKVGRFLEDVSSGDDKNSVGDDKDFVPSSLSKASFSKEKLFSLENVSVIKRLCDTIINVGPINKSRIESTLERSTEGKHLLDQYSIENSPPNVRNR